MPEHHRELAIEPISRVRHNPRVEFEEKERTLLEKKGSSFEMFRALLSIYGLTNQNFNRTFFERDKAVQDAMYQNMMENTVMGKNYAGVSWRAGCEQGIALGIGAVTGFTNAGQAGGTVLGAWKDYAHNQYQIEKAFHDHKYQTQKLLEQTTSDAISRIRASVAQTLQLIQKLDQERSTAVTTMYRAS